MELANWFVFETIDADGALAIGVAQGEPNPSAVMVVRDGLTRRAAVSMADRLAAEHRTTGRLVDDGGDAGDRSVKEP